MDKRAVIDQMLLPAARLTRGLKHNPLRSGANPGSLGGEREKLQNKWKKHEPKDLDNYLVIGHHDPRINAQSVIARHFLIKAILGPDHGLDAMMREELDLCVTSTKRMTDEIGLWTLRFATPEVLMRKLSPFSWVKEQEMQARWVREISQRNTSKVSVLELACGSANDYRYMHEYGLGEHIDYSGIDLNPANIENALRRFPDINFRVGNAMDLPLEDNSVDFVIAFDFLEHLSLEAMYQVMREATRVARRGLVISFFNMTFSNEHKQIPFREYHVNELSSAAFKREIERNYSKVSSVHVDSLLRGHGGRFHNRKAWTLFAEK